MKLKLPKIFRSAAIIVTAALTFSSAMSAFAAETQDPLSDPELNTYIEKIIENYDTPGITAAVVNSSDTYFKSCGYADISGNTAMSENSVVSIGSCSKAFTALSVFLLQEEGKLSIDDSVSEYIPWWNVTWQGEAQDTKLWQLLDHCSGIPDSTMMLEPIGSEDTALEETVHIAENLKLTYEPGTEFQYCNLGYDILSYIVAEVSGMPFEDYVKQEILLPLGMTHSGYDIPTVQGYRPLFGSQRPYNEPPMKGSYGSGGLRSTAEDMACWINAQLGNARLPEKLENAIAATHTVPEKYKIPQSDFVYSFGWIVDEEYRFHTGTVPAFSTTLIIDEERGVGIFASSNTWSYTADYYARGTYSLIKGEALDTEQSLLPDIMSLLDIVSSIAAVIGLAAAVIVLLLIFTRKKRYAKKQTTVKKERKKLIIRCILLIPSFILSALLPDILLTAMGYGRASYRMVGVWVTYSFLTAVAVICAVIALMLISSILRFAYFKRKLK